MNDSELRYRTLIEQLPLVTYIDALDDRSSNIYTSPQLESILGYSVGEWQADGELFVRILHPDDRERVLDRIRATNASGDRFECEYRLIARDGRVVWFHDEAITVRDESGTPLYSQGYLLDITERKAAERRVRESEQRFHTMADHAPALIWTAEPSGAVTFFSSSWLEFTGRTLDEEIGDGWVECVHPDDRAAAFDGYLDAIRARREYQVEYRLRRHDGVYRWIMDRGGPHFSADGTLVGYIGVGVDVTEQKEAQEALARREAVLEAVAVIAGELVAEAPWEDADVVGRLRAAVQTSRAYLVRDLPSESGSRTGQLIAESTDGTVGSMAHAGSGGRFDYDDDGFAAFRAALERGEIVRRVAGEFPESERSEWEREGVLSTLVVPIQVGGEHWGHIGFQDCRVRRQWTDAEADALRAGAGILGAAIRGQATVRELRRTSENLEALVRATPAGIVGLDPDGRVIIWNPGAERIFGWTAAEAIGRACPFVDEEHRPEFEEYLRRGLAGEMWSGDEVRRRRRDGTAVDLSASSAPLQDGDGARVGLVSVVIDVTEEKRARDALAETSHALEAIVRSSPLPIVTFDPDGRVRRWNDAAERTFGWSADEVLGRFDPTLPEGEERRFLAMLEHVLEGRGWREVEVGRRRRDGSSIDVRVSSAPLRAASGEVVGVVAMLADVTERRRAERRLAAQHAVTRVLAECTTLDEAGPRILENVCGALGWKVGGLWTVDDERDRLRLASIWHTGSRTFDRFVDESRSLELDRGDGFPGAVWESGEAQWFADVTGSSRARTAAVAAAGLRGALAVPIVSGGEILGVLELFSTSVWEPDDDLIAMLTSVGRQVGQFLRRAQAVRDVREREERFRTLVANLPGAIYRCAVDEDWTASYMSDVILEITGYPASDFIGSAVRSFASVIHADDRAQVDEVIGEAVRRKRPFELQYRVVHADGSVHWVSEKGQPIIGPGGDVLWRDGAIFDVTEQRRAEAALAQERDLMRIFMQATPDHVYFKDRESRFLRISDALARWLGLEDAAGAVGKTDHDFFTGEHAAKALADEQEVLRTGEPMLNVEERETWPDGSDTWVVSSRLPLRNEHGEIVGTFGISRDITERKRGEEALARTNHLLDSIVELLPTPLFLKDADDLRFVRVNRAAEELWGFSREELVGKSDADFFPPEQAASFAAKDRTVLEGQQLLDIPDEPIETRARGRRYLHTRKVPVVDERGRSRYLLGISRDITEQKLAAEELERLLGQLEQQNEQLRALDEMKDEFVALVSHELRTPLTSILGYLDLVLEGEAGEVTDGQAQFLAVVERNARRLLRLVGDLLLVAQIEAGKLGIEREPCDLAQLATDCIEAARPRAAERQLELVLHGHSSVPFEGDRTRLAQLLDNLVSNAIKFTPEGGRVRVGLTRSPEQVVLQVSDTGMGISPADQRQLFQRFFRTSEANRRAIQGTGLGLTITKAIVEAHEGSIVVESEPGAGTTFTVCLPAAAGR